MSTASNWQKKMNSLSNKISFDNLCKMFGLETLEEFNERMMMYGDGSYHSNFTYAREQEGMSEEEAEVFAQEAEAEECGEEQNKYIAAVEKVASVCFKSTISI